MNTRISIQAKIQAAARQHAQAVALDQIDPSDVSLMANDTVEHYFKRLRDDAPVHKSHSPVFGDYWSITRYQDIMAVDMNHAVFSSRWDLGGIAIVDRPEEYRRPSFIAMDPPKHDVQRNAVSPIVAPMNLAKMESLIRERTCGVLDGLPRNETFDWVERTSIELTTLMLATLFDFPLEDRKLLTWWSDVSSSIPGVDGIVPTYQAMEEVLAEMGQYMGKLWNERVNAPPKGDLISMLAHNPETRNMAPREFLSNCILLVIGGNDTTRNSMTGGLLALLENPEQFAKLRSNPALIESLVPEIIRWQTPLAHMRRTCVADIEFGGQQIRKGEKVIMWYLSGNRDERAIDRPDEFLIDRARPRQHLSFGFGIHRCVGNRLAELQLRILWEEILRRDLHIELVGEPVRNSNPLVHGFVSMPVRIAG